MEDTAEVTFTIEDIKNKIYKLYYEDGIMEEYIGIEVIGEENIIKAFDEIILEVIEEVDYTQDEETGDLHPERLDWFRDSDNKVQETS